jgi:hypothetical protein
MPTSWKKNHARLDDISLIIERTPNSGWEFANPPKKIKTIVGIKEARRLPTPATQDERVENIQNASACPIFIPTLPTGEVSLSDNDEIEEILEHSSSREPNVFFRVGGMVRDLLWGRRAE